MFQTFFTRRALKRKLGNRKALQGHSGTQALGRSRYLGTRSIRKLGGNLGTRALKALWYLGTRALEGYFSTQLLRLWNTWKIEALDALYLADFLLHIS